MSLENIYYDPERGYSGINDLQRKYNKSIKEVKQFAAKQDVYTNFQPIRNKFGRRGVILQGTDDQCKSDLVEVKSYKYLLTFLYIFSKYAWVIQLKNKICEQNLQASLEIFKSKRMHKKIKTGQGLNCFIRVKYRDCLKMK